MAGKGSFNTEEPFSDIVKRGYLTPLIKKLNKTPIIGDCTQRADFLLFASQKLGYQTK